MQGAGAAMLYSPVAEFLLFLIKLWKCGVLAAAMQVCV